MEFAGVAQLVEHLICNQRVRGSNPFASSRLREYGGARVFNQRNALHEELSSDKCLVLMRKYACAFPVPGDKQRPRVGGENEFSTGLRKRA